MKQSWMFSPSSFWNEITQSMNLMWPFERATWQPSDVPVQGRPGTGSTTTLRNSPYSCAPSTTIGIPKQPRTFTFSTVTCRPECIVMPFLP